MMYKKLRIPLAILLFIIESIVYIIGFVLWMNFFMDEVKIIAFSNINGMVRFFHYIAMALYLFLIVDIFLQFSSKCIGIYLPTKNGLNEKIRSLKEEYKSFKDIIETSNTKDEIKNQKVKEQYLEYVRWSISQMKTYEPYSLDGYTIMKLHSLLGKASIVSGLIAFVIFFFQIILLITTRQVELEFIIIFIISMLCCFIFHFWKKKRQGIYDEGYRIFALHYKDELEHNIEDLEKEYKEKFDKNKKED